MNTQEFLEVLCGFWIVNMGLYGAFVQFLKDNNPKVLLKGDTRLSWIGHHRDFSFSIQLPLLNY